MTYREWLLAVEGYTLSQLRCDEPPTPDLLDLIDLVGMDRWERYVGRLQTAKGKA